MFHLKYSAKKIKVLDFVGSVYTFENQGIWSALSQKQQFNYQINYQTKHKDMVNTLFEKNACDNIIEYNKRLLKSATDEYRKYSGITIDEALKKIKRYADIFSFKHKDYVLNNFYYSEYLDSLCCSLAYIFNVHHPLLCQREVNENHLCIVNANINPKGGGIFAEIDEIIDIFKDKKVFLIITGEYNSAESIELLNEGVEILKKHNNLTIVIPPKDVLYKYMWLREKMAEINPYRTYYYCSHSDPYGASLPQIQSENTVLFSFDHGFVCGLLNPMHNFIITKRRVDFWLLKKVLGEKILLIPTWEREAEGCNEYTYVPFFNHDKIITASGAARFYKVDGNKPYRYVDYILELLKRTHGTHYHFGPVPDNVLEEVYSRLTDLGISKDSFIHIPWSSNIPLDLLKNKVDIFIEPFPVVSYKLSLLVESIGIPIIAKRGLSRMNIIDFVPDDCLYWTNMNDFIDKMLSLDKETLLEYSKKTRSYFFNNHRIDLIKNLLFKNEGIGEPSFISFSDDCPMDIMQTSSLFGTNYNIRITTDIVNDKKRAQFNLNRNGLQNIVDKNVTGEVYNSILNIRSNPWFSFFYSTTFCIRLARRWLKQDYGNSKVNEFVSMRRENANTELNALKASLPYKLARFFDKHL